MANDSVFRPVDPRSWAGKQASKVQQILTDRYGISPYDDRAWAVIANRIIDSVDAAAAAAGISTTAARRYFNADTCALDLSRLFDGEGTGEGGPWADSEDVLMVPVTHACRVAWACLIIARGAALAGETGQADAYIVHAAKMNEYVALRSTNAGQRATVELPRTAVTYTARLLRQGAGAFRDGDYPDPDGFDNGPLIADAMADDAAQWTVAANA